MNSYRADLVIWENSNAQVGEVHALLTGWLGKFSCLNEAVWNLGNRETAIDDEEGEYSFLVSSLWRSTHMVMVMVIVLTASSSIHQMPVYPRPNLVAYRIVQTLA